MTIVAVGASAGGLEAMQELFKSAPADPRLCFVVVTHLPSHHVSYLAEILARAGILPASAATDGQLLEGAHVYVMPPGKWMGVRDGRLFFEEKPAQRFERKPIDFFMMSLAESAEGLSGGIVLSGLDHDGTAGLKAIRAAGGLTLVQAPGTADFPDMPNSAIEAGVVDLVLPPAAMVTALLDLLGRHGVDAGLQPADGADDSQNADTDLLREILAAVLARTGNDFRWYRLGMVRRRLRRRMVLLGCERVSDYLALLKQSPDEAATLGAEFLIGVTDFFRDPEAWDELAEGALPALLADRQADDAAVRAWTPGCSSGEESYSVAMLLLEQLAARNVSGSVQVFGTDIDQAALAVARRGAYSKAIESTVSPQRLQRFFEVQGNKYVVRKPLRDAVMFAPQNLVCDTPFSKLDLVCCRNVLMYFEPALQEQVFDLFHFALKPGGLLWLGKAESLGAHSAMFEPVSRSNRLFRRIGGRSHLPRGFAGLRTGGEMPDERRGAPQRPQPAGELLRQQLAARQVGAAVLIDREGRALHFHGDTGRFLAPKAMRRSCCCTWCGLSCARRSAASCASL